MHLSSCSTRSDVPLSPLIRCGSRLCGLSGRRGPKTIQFSRFATASTHVHRAGAMENGLRYVVDIERRID
jgi:hypothetical protein